LSRISVTKITVLFTSYREAVSAAISTLYELGSMVHTSLLYQHLGRNTIQVV